MGDPPGRSAFPISSISVDPLVPSSLVIPSAVIVSSGNLFAGVSTGGWIDMQINASSAHLTSFSFFFTSGLVCVASLDL